jgi:hypothetical protein
VGGQGSVHLRRPFTTPLHWAGNLDSVLALPPTHPPTHPPTRAGTQLIAVHKGRVFKEADGLSLGPGPFVLALEHASRKAATVR